MWIPSIASEQFLEIQVGGLGEVGGPCLGRAVQPPLRGGRNPWSLGPGVETPGYLHAPLRGGSYLYVPVGGWVGRGATQ